MTARKARVSFDFEYIFVCIHRVACEYRSRFILKFYKHVDFINTKVLFGDKNKVK